jgi:hypothetical protein
MPDSDIRRTLAKLDLPLEGVTVVGMWPVGPGGRAAIQLGPGTFWWVVRRTGLPVTTTEPEAGLLPYRYQLTLDGIECFTLSAEPILPAGVLTPGYALRLT